jgi:hypothetical protein
MTLEPPLQRKEATIEDIHAPEEQYIVKKKMKQRKRKAAQRAATEAAGFWLQDQWRDGWVDGLMIDIGHVWCWWGLYGKDKVLQRAVSTLSFSKAFIGWDY